MLQRGRPRRCRPRAPGTLSANRTLPSALVTARLRTRPSGAASSRLSRGSQPEHGAVEQDRLVEVVERLRERDVVDALEQRRRSASPAGPSASKSWRQPSPAAVVGAAEEDRGAVGGGDRGEVGLARPARRGEDRGEQRLGARRGRARVGALDARSRRRPAALRRGGVEQHPDRRPAATACTGFVRCCARGANPSACSTRCVSPTDAGVDAELDEGVAVEPRGRGSRRGACRGASASSQDQQRAHRVDRRPVRVGLAEDVVEDLERQRPGVAGVEHAADEAGEVEAALAGEAAVVPAPLQDVHDEVRRVGELEEEELLGRDRGDRVEARAARQDVEAVQARARAPGGRRARRSARRGRTRRRAGPRPAPRRRSAGRASPARSASRAAARRRASSSSTASARDVRADEHRRRAELAP